MERQAGLCELALPFIGVSNSGLARLLSTRPLGGPGAGAPAETEDVEKRVTHHPVPSVNSARDFADAEKAGDIGRAVLVDGDPAVLVM